jgi:hypothetical protein
MPVYFIYWQPYQMETLKFTDNRYPASFAVIELFTSQSCSSCPPANVLFEKLKAVIKEKNLPVYPLAFHVDYWNHLGWRDTFSSANYTERQYKYGHSFKKLNVYTPQIILNGTIQFTGSDVRRCIKELNAIMAVDNIPQFDISAEYTQDSDSVYIRFKVDETFHGIVNFALIQKEGVVKIKNGENEGKNLNYQNIVRCFKQINCFKNYPEKVTFLKPQELDPGDMEVIVYLQNKVNMQILNALKADLL